MNKQSIPKDQATDLLSEERLYGLPQRSDSEFLIHLRGKISGHNAGIWIPQGRLALMGGLTLLLMFCVWLPSERYRDIASEQVEQPALSETVAEFIETDVDPLELAEFLGFSEAKDTVSISNQEDPSAAVPTDVESSPELDTSTDDLLELDEPDLELVLAEIQDTEFF